ncbi:MAG: pentapeptide repeat-containing protein [Opitutales bacterium]|nr:pentapeptide repeat-containing protein [Opitutales bacterium]
MLPLPVHTMIRWSVLFFFFVQLCMADVPVPHTGHVSVSGTPYWGTGKFKFSIIDGNGKLLWNHDGSTSAIPLNDISIEVKNGFYSLHLGDSSISGMKTLPASALSSAQKAFLRVWFDQGTGNFQQLDVDLALGAAPFALVSELSRSGGTSFESRIKALENIVAKIPASAIDPVLLAEVGYRKFSARNLIGLSFPKLNLDQADFRAATIKSANLYQSSMLNAIFQDATIEDSNFSESIITTSNLTNSKFKSLNLINANASGSTFAGNESNSSDFSQANLSLCDFNDANFIDCNFTNANFQGASLQSSSFNNCNLSNTNLTNLDGQSVNFSNSNLSNTTISGNLNNAKFLQAVLSGADFSSANLTGANLTGAVGFLPSSYTNVIYSNTILPDGTVRNN